MPIPSPSPNEDQDAFMARCVPVLIGEGKPSDQAAAICFGAFREAAHYDKKKRKREGVEALNCDPFAVDPDDADTISAAAILHAWAHRLWPAVAGTDAAKVALDMHEDAIALGAAVGIPHEACDDLDAQADRVQEQEDSFVPPKGAQAAAERGLRLRKEHGRGGTDVGVARARDLANGRALSLETIGRMVSFFARHGGQNAGKPPAQGEDPDAGYIAWLLWGGDPGRTWAERIWKRERESVQLAEAFKRHRLRP